MCWSVFQFLAKRRSDVRIKTMARTVESAVVILPPKETWDQINEIRKTYDRAYPRWMPHINLIYPFVKETEFQKEQHKIARHLSEIKPFTVCLTKDSFGHFTHGKGSTIWVKPVISQIPQGGVTETHQVAPQVVTQPVKQKKPEKVWKTVKKMVKKVVPVEVYDKPQVAAPTIVGYPNPNPHNYPVTSGLDALNDAIWGDDIIEKRESSQEYGLDLLRYAIWGIEKNNNIYPEIGGVQKFQHKNSMNYDKFFGPSYYVGESKKRIEYQEVWEEEEVEVEEVEVEKAEEVDNDGFMTVGKKKKRKPETHGASNVEKSATSPDVINLQRKLYEMYPSETSDVINGDFNPHVTLGQCKTSNMANTVEKLKQNWKDLSFEVNEIHLISRRGQNDNFATRKSVPFGVLSSDE